MHPVIALVGRPNVGKSTLFNQLTRTRDALVADQPGLTRDRKYGLGRVGGRPYIVVDTGGLSGEDISIDAKMAEQTHRAIDESDVVLFLVDARAGLTAADDGIGRRLRTQGKQVVLVLNKTDGVDADVAAADFHGLGLGVPVPIAAAHGRGVPALIERALGLLPPAEEGADEIPEEEAGIKVAIVGRPNVGKSTLVNRLLGEERVVAHDLPGTTRDSIFVPLERDGTRYTLIDTAGVRRRARVEEAVEKFSIIKTLQAVDEAHVVVVLLDATEGVTDQDTSLLGLVLDAGRGLVIAVNKWDGLHPDQREKVKRDLDRKLEFVDFARTEFVSALHGTGIDKIMRAVDKAHRAAMRDLPTPELTRVLEQAVQQHAPPMAGGSRIKLRYAHQGGRNPPLIVIHGNRTDRLPDAYRRYLANAFRQAFRLQGTPVRMEFRTGTNPFEGKRNELTPRQIAKRRRLMRHAKRR